MPITDPTDIANCTLWLKGDAGTFEDTGLATPAADDGDPVKGWEDQSAGGNDATEATNNPILETSEVDSKNVVHFDGSNDILSTGSMFDSTYNAAFTVCNLCTIDSVGTATLPIVFSAQPDLALFMMMASTGWPNADFNLNNLLMQLQLNPGDSETKFEIRVASSTGFHFYCVSVGASYAYAQADRHGLVRRISSGSMGLSGVGRLGCYTGGGAPFFFDGKILEQTIHKAQFTGQHLQDMQDYLAGRWPSAIGSTTLVYCDGDSITAGMPDSNAGQSYPYQLLAELGTGYRTINAGVSSTTLDTMEGDAATRVDDFLPSGDHVCVCFGGTNDLHGGTAVATVQTRYQTYCESRQTAGWKVVACTILPRSDAGTPVGFETDRQTFNTWLSSNWATFADALADLGADSRIGDAGDETDTTYYSADLVHLNATGYGVIAELVGAAVQSLFPAGSVSPNLLHSNLLQSHLLTGLAR